MAEGTQVAQGSDYSSTLGANSVQSSNGGGGGSAPGEGYAAAGTATLQAIIAWILNAADRKAIEKYRAEDRAQAERLRSDQLLQQQFTNSMTLRSLADQEKSYDFGVARWGKEFRFAQRQYADSKAAADSQVKKDNLKNAINTLVSNAQGNMQLQQVLKANYGA